MFAATGLHFKGKKVKKGWRLGMGKVKREKRKVKSEKSYTFFKEEN